MIYKHAFVGECPANPPDKPPPQGARKWNNSEVPAPQGHKRWWELGEHPHLPPLAPAYPRDGRGGGGSVHWMTGVLVETLN